MRRSLEGLLLEAAGTPHESIEDVMSWSGSLALDRRDPLRKYREAFAIPLSGAIAPDTDRGGDAHGADGAMPENGAVAAVAGGGEAVYLCGNSLGLQPRRARERVLQHLEQWSQLGVVGHFQGGEPWMPIEDRAIDAGGADIVGALPVEVVYMNTLTVNLHLMMIAFYQPTSQRYRILMEADAFPSDRYAVTSHVACRGLDPDDALVFLRPAAGSSGHYRIEDIEACIREHASDVALILLPGVHYLTGQVLPMEHIVRAARAASPDVRVGFDLAHAVGNVPLRLHDWGPDFACWCSYKYLNGGPGAVAGCFVHERHAHRTGADGVPRFSGWWANRRESRFRMLPVQELAAGAVGFQLSNPPVLSLMPVIASLELIRDAGGMQALRRKSVLLTGYLELLLRRRLADQLRVLTPSDRDERGCQLSLQLTGVLALAEVHTRLLRHGVVCDVREPDVLRVAPVPLYNTFADAHRFCDVLEAVLVALRAPDAKK
ncbi:hypothetical protein CDCA_CDCA06G1965 [Cyanidium caldarium]|uniref:Kynureninase n=1 Tax=Cyanidium caldarium TaxID=2771 RepID=A0AAV9IUG6_CYACA|nr:hypothetical protein CDCA_CDCA06G1965 [Cyanidium caldarium]